MFAIRPRGEDRATHDLEPPEDTSQLRQFFLDRLERLAALNSVPDSPIAREDARLLRFAMYSTYWDCVHLGLRNEARKTLGQHCQPHRQAIASEPAAQRGE